MVLIIVGVTEGEARVRPAPVVFVSLVMMNVC
jgi:hypothetical protein